MRLYIYTKFGDKSFDGFKLTDGKDTVFILKSTKGHNSVKNEDGVAVLVLCTLSDNVLYLYQVA